MTIPTVQECVDSAVAAIESHLSQDVPTYDKSFLRVLSVVIGMTNAELYRFGVQRAKQVLALTAVGDDLTQLGYEYGIRRKQATKALLNVQIGLTGGGAGSILRTDVLKSDENGMYYFPIQDYSFTILDPYVFVDARAEFAGAQGNLTFPAPLLWNSTPEYASNAPNVYAVTEVGTDEETDDELRIRILDEVQSVGGGSNMADYRTWGQRTPNVARVDPYTGKEAPYSSVPWDLSLPGERTCFIEATTSYDPDGVADATLLNLATDYINYDQDTGLRQPCLGSTDDTLYVRSITPVTMYYNIRNLSVTDPSKYYECQVAIEETLDELSRAMRPFILGLDAEAFRNDVMTPSLASRHVQRVVQAFGGSVGSVDIGISTSSWEQSYQMNPGERLRAEVYYDLPA